MDFTPIYLSFKLAFISTTILLFISLFLVYFIEKIKSPFQSIINSLITLPIVLPPSVLGFYLLVLFSKFPNFNLLFSFKGLVVASIIYSLPFMVQPIQTGIKQLNKSMIEAAYIAGKNELQTFIKIVIPNIKNYIFVGIIMSFAHTIGEFGVILMIGGSIPNETEVASIAIYNYTENMDYEKANIYSLILLGFSFFTILLVNFTQSIFNDRNKNR